MLLKILHSGVLTLHRRNFETLVSTSWLANRIKESNKNVKILQASWDNCREYNDGHIPTALCFNGAYCRDNQSPYKNILPPPDLFQKYNKKLIDSFDFGSKVNDTLTDRYVSELGISNDSHVVVYDDSPTLPSLEQGARVLFMFRVFGHDKVSLLNGGLYVWNEEKRPLETVAPKVEKTDFVAKYRPELESFFDDVLENIETKSFQLVDCRAPGRYHGIGLEPLGKAGHIPNAVNIPVSMLIDPDTKLIRDKAELEKIFKKAKIDINKPLTTSCGTGINACAVIFAAQLLGKSDAKLYNGSWYEWNRRVGDDLIVK